MPARCCSTRVGLQGTALPAAQDDRGDAMTFGRELQAAACDQVEHRHLTDNSPKIRTPQGFFDGPERVVVASRPRVDQPIGIKAEYRQPRCIEPRSFAAPQGFALGADNQVEQGSSKSNDSLALIGLDLVQPSEREIKTGAEARGPPLPGRRRGDKAAEGCEACHIRTKTEQTSRGKI